jgi:protein TonB
MEANKILSANFLDLVFDNRNKEYGAYELRVTYPERVKKSLLVVFLIAAVAVAGAAWAKSFKPSSEKKFIATEIFIRDLTPEKKEVVPPPPPKRIEPPQVHTEIYTPPRIVVDKDVEKPPPTLDDLDKAIIDTKQRTGIDDDGTIKKPDELNQGTGIIEEKKNGDEVIDAGSLDMPARYDGDWVKFLTRNLNAEVPVENGAPVGRYNVMVQFVVDREGNLSDIVPLTNFGFGMEQEAIRVLKKAKGWKPGMQHGHEVKCYHRQPITFVVEESN